MHTLYKQLFKLFISFGFIIDKMAHNTTSSFNNYMMYVIILLLKVCKVNRIMHNIFN